MALFTYYVKPLSTVVYDSVGFAVTASSGSYRYLRVSTVASRPNIEQ